MIRVVEQPRRSFYEQTVGAVVLVVRHAVQKLAIAWSLFSGRTTREQASGVEWDWCKREDQASVVVMQGLCIGGQWRRRAKKARLHRINQSSISWDLKTESIFRQTGKPAHSLWPYWVHSWLGHSASLLAVKLSRSSGSSPLMITHPQHFGDELLMWEQKQKHICCDYCLQRHIYTLS